ncbi:hypothetical protein [Aerosakkonema funiforme]|nr:hypothetical protein [Aerosakkonema funiforme]
MTVKCDRTFSEFWKMRSPNFDRAILRHLPSTILEQHDPGS